MPPDDAPVTPESVALAPAAPPPSPPEPDLRDAGLVPAEIVDDLSARAALGSAKAIKHLQTVLGTNAVRTKAYLRKGAMLEMKRQGRSCQEIADLLGMKVNNVRCQIYLARKQGILNDLRDLLEHDTTALAVDTINHHLQKRDKAVAIEHLKGMGMYRTHSHVKNEGGAGFTLPPLQVNVVVQNSVGTPVSAPETVDAVSAGVGVARDDAL